MLNRFLDWLVTSSADPTEYSLTIKAGLLTGVGYIIPLLKLTHIPVSADQLTNLIGVSCQCLGILLTIVGLVRKFYFTIAGAVIKAHAPATVVTVDPSTIQG